MHTLLIVDDNPDVLESFSFALLDEFHVLTASCGQKALDVISEHGNPFSVVLLDLDMPGMKGVDVLQKIRSSAGQVPVIVITGRSNHEWAKRCADLGVQGYLDKPVDIEELTGKIRKLLKTEDYELLRTIWNSDYKSRMSSLSPNIRKALAYIQKNYNKELTREDVAFYLDVTPGHLGRKFFQECGIHLKDYINILRVCKCKECLKEFDKKIGEIGPEIGISNANYMIRLFKRHTGLTPQEFRKKHLAP